MQINKKAFKNIANVTDQQLKRIIEIRLKMHYLEITTIDLAKLVGLSTQYIQSVLSCNYNMSDKFYFKLVLTLDNLIMQQDDQQALCLINQLSYLKYFVLLEHKQQQDQLQQEDQK